jgi:hypothetical protein
VVYISDWPVLNKGCVKAWGSFGCPFVPVPERTLRGGEIMVLHLYHDDHDPFTIYNVIKVTLDGLRTLVVTTKHRQTVDRKFFRYKTDYQRLTIQID